MNKYPISSISRRVALAATFLAMPILSSCTEQSAEIPASVMDGTSAEGLPGLVYVGVGETAFLNVVSPDSDDGKTLKAETSLVDHQYPGGLNDSKGPSITNSPTRFNVRVSTGGQRSNTLSNDAACEVFNILNPDDSVAAIALGGEERGVFISRPGDNKTVVVCSFQKKEPHKDEGALLFTTDTPR